MATSIRIAYIGGGSRHWAPVLMQDLGLAEGLGGEVVLHDLVHARAERNAALGAAIFAHREARSRFTVRAEADLDAALTGADVVVISILPGPMTCFAHDLDIPLRHGVVQTVGDTVGPGGLSRCLRTVPVFTGFARAIARVCPDAWVINYTNPMTVATQALVAECPHLKVVGCCHEVFGTRSWIAGMVAAHRGLDRLHRNDLEVEVVGLNHFTFFTRARFQGEDARPAIAAWLAAQGDFFRDRTADALAREAQGRFGSCDGLVQLDVLRRFGVIGAAGDRHLVEFVPWYCTSVERLRRWGVSVTGSAQRLAGWTPDNVETVPAAPEHLKASKEEGVRLIEALTAGRGFTTNVNVPNCGQIPWLPEGHVVETLAEVGRDRICPLTTGPFPDGLKVHVQAVAAQQALTLAAARTCDHDLAVQALLADPLCRLAPDAAVRLLDELVEANRPHLPEGWR